MCALLGSVAAAVAALTPRRSYATVATIAVFIIPTIIAALLAELAEGTIARYAVLFSPGDTLDPASTRSSSTSSPTAPWSRTPTSTAGSTSRRRPVWNRGLGGPRGATGTIGHVTTAPSPVRRRHGDASQLGPVDERMLVSVERVSRWYGNVVAGQRRVVLGGSGRDGTARPERSGQDDAAALLAGLLAPSAGRYGSRGRRCSGPGRVPPRRARPRARVGLPVPRRAGVRPAQRPARGPARLRIERALTTVELTDAPTAHRHVFEGMRQRIKMASALVHTRRCSCSTSRSTGWTPASASTCSSCSAPWPRRGGDHYVVTHPRRGRAGRRLVLVYVLGPARGRR